LPVQRELWAAVPKKFELERDAEEKEESAECEAIVWPSGAGTLSQFHARHSLRRSLLFASTYRASNSLLEIAQEEFHDAV
jgi:hypothetical protein